MSKTHMTPEELKQAIIHIYGTLHGSQRKLAAQLGRHEVSVSRWMSGVVPIDRAMANAIRVLAAQKQPAPKAKRVSISEMF
jgi:DNA-binding transcriptional regulator YdaS (Cro superfamily)